MDLCDFKGSLVYSASSRTAGAIGRPCLKMTKSRAWWRMPLILALGRQRQADLCEFKASLVYRVSSRTAGATGRPCLEKTKKKKMDALITDVDMCLGF